MGIDHIGALILPNAATAFGIFFLRQFFRTLPIEYEESARVDGASRRRAQPPPNGQGAVGSQPAA